MRAILFIIFSCCISIAIAQHSVVASGGDASGSGGKVAFSVGQVSYTSNSGSSGTLAEGVQHPFEIYIITGNDETNRLLSLSAYPNPTEKMLILNVADYNNENLSFLLADVNGKVIQNKKISSSITEIQMHDFSSGIYYLSVVKNGIDIKTFKIIKN